MSIVRRTTNGVIETFSGTAGTGHTIDLSDAAIGDLRFVDITGNPDGTGTVGSLTLPTGWSWAGTQTETGAASTGMLSRIYRVVQSGDTLTSATLSLTYNNSVMVSSIATTWEGVDTTTPLDQTVPTYTTGSSPPSSPSITTQTDGALLLVACNVDGAPTWGDTDIPSGFTLNGTASHNPPSNGQNIGSAYQIQATAGASGTKSWTNGGSEEYVASTVALRPGGGISSVTPDEFDMNESDIDIESGAYFDASGNTVYISDSDTLAGSVNEVDISSAINTETTSLINLDLTLLSASELADLHTLGPGARYIIVDPVAGEASKAITLHRPEGFRMSAGLGTPGVTTARLTAPATKTTADFDSGRFEEAANPATTVDITADDYTELVWSIEAKNDAREVAYVFRVTKAGDPLTTYTVTPQVTISAAAEITADGGVYTATGQDASLNLGLSIVAEGDSSTIITGTAVGFVIERLASADNGALSVVAQTTELITAGRMEADGGAVNFSGQDVNLSLGLVLISDGSSLAFTGQDTTLTKLLDYNLTAESGSFNLVGADTGTIKKHIILINEGLVVVLSPDIANIIVDHIHGSDSGTYLLSGQDANFTVLQITNVDAESGVFSIVGTDADFTNDWVLETDSGSVSLSGQDANLTKLLDFEIVAESGSYSTGGVDTDLISDRLLSADGIGLAFTGQDASIFYNPSVVNEGGAFLMSSPDETILDNDSILDAEAYSITVTGQDASLTVVNFIIIQGNTGAFNVTGSSMDFVREQIFGAESGAVSVTGPPANTEYHRVLPSVGETVAISGDDASLVVRVSKTLQADTGTITVVGADVSFGNVYRINNEGEGLVLHPPEADLLKASLLEIEESICDCIGSSGGALLFLRSVVNEPATFNIVGFDIQFASDYTARMYDLQFIIDGGDAIVVKGDRLHQIVLNSSEIVTLLSGESETVLSISSDSRITNVLTMDSEMIPLA